MSDAKIDDLGPAIGREQNILRLDIAVNDALLVEFGQPFANTNRQIDRLLDGQFTLGIEQPLQGTAR